ncbi:MAG: hypothetical protein HY816_18160 [Candidatus Wallbacteria bacterium]|nr:hypothetical protein [Candidatus Wallbacteria bacterium]
MPADPVDFPRAFEFEVLQELPGFPTQSPPIYYLPEGPGVGADGIGVRFSPPESSEWIGIFKFGSLAPHSHTGVHGHPDPSRLCVVSRGSAYFASATRPGLVFVPAPQIVTQVWPCLELGLLLLVDPWELYAYGAEGERWHTGRIALDGLRILERKGSTLRLSATDLEEDLEVTVDLVTGKCQGQRAWGP